MIESWENLVTDGQMDRQMERWKDKKGDESDFIGRFPTNVERPTSNIQSTMPVLSEYEKQF